MIQEGPARWLGELLQATIWGAHALGAAVWVGGALVFLLVVRPALRAAPAPGRGQGRGEQTGWPGWSGRWGPASRKWWR